jgi:uncharacterized membrane protein
MSRDEEPDDTRPSVWRYALGGLLCTVFGVPLVVIAQRQMFEIWIRWQGTQPDFGDNGLSYLAIAVALVLPFIDLGVFIVVFLIAVPLTCSRHRFSGVEAIPVGRWILIACGIVAVLYALLLTSWFWRPLFLVLGGPVIAVMALGLWILLTRANSDRRLNDRPH